MRSPEEQGEVQGEEKQNVGKGGLFPCRDAIESDRMEIACSLEEECQSLGKKSR